MAKGDVITLNFETFVDSDTQVKVTRLTPTDVICHRNYFYQKCFTQDGKKLLFAGDFDGNRNYYLLNLETQQAVQLTEGKGDNTFGGFISTDERAFFYVKNELNLMKVDLETLEEQVIYTVDEEWKGYGTWVANSDCTKLVGIEILKRDWQPLTSWEKFAEFYHTNPTCRLIQVDIETGELEVIHQDTAWLGHPIYRPFDDSTVGFCHEGPHDLVDARMWLVNEDGSNVRKIKEHAEGESCTHEFWIPDGSAMAYVSYFKGQTDRVIYKANPETLENEEVMVMPPCSHLMSNFDGSLMVGDGCDAPVDVADADSYNIENDPFLYVLNTKAKSAQKLCKHSTSWDVLDGDRQITHPHPSFTPNDDGVLFTSDFEGVPAIYIADVPESYKH
ncbi:TPA: oligogalacturonate lyase family protein [Vibrio parahaemolyticus]|uniref:oligogalacturonate lyase family protein n=1 Tax=Vibrio parahaemolyticus TaxID=670 RepID=UPI00038E22CF|nr:oligogalacturonate lyase family protein [Vibrio parahaemolyticus]EGR1118521.1 oligogalacturonate lyase [Vibrio parahaemolyticus]EQM14973.1 oligogalacturonate lyase [Vibrio parahaemolyticus 3259]ETJ92904.1 oligogalacturonate lyase [Vibrio parahaemolyticus EKP-008]HCH2418791.1 oligogalacturonate lyase family protein [Vibrio parahaemolyticus]HCH2421764.1 oligogalacturonate lyase family protein [Vibrio parahaemolyticus]